MVKLAIPSRFTGFICTACRQRFLQPAICSRPFTTTITRGAEDQRSRNSPFGQLASNIIDPDEKQALNKMFGEDRRLGQRSAAGASSSTEEDGSTSLNDPFRMIDELSSVPKLYHLHIFCTKHNTHITLTDPQRNPVISKSTGNIGFRKAARGTYDAAYQLATYTLGQIYDNVALFQKMKRVEVVFRGFDIGREAVMKVLLGVEGKKLRPKIVQVTDATRIKFGGTRSKKPRRLG